MNFRVDSSKSARLAVWAATLCLLACVSPEKPVEPGPSEPTEPAAWQTSKPARFASSSSAVTASLQAYSIDSIVAGLNADLARNPDTSHVTFDSAYGFPAQAWVDLDYRMADEEHGFSITGFCVLPGP